MLASLFVSLLAISSSFIGVEAHRPGKGKPLPKLSDGVLVTQCRINNTIAITFDDGPWIYTSDLIDEFNKAGAKATFFVNGNLYGCIYDRADVIQKAFAWGHQIAHHTWSHPHMLELSSEEQDEEIERLQVALTRIIGVRTKWMRPPFGETNSTLQEKFKQHKLKAANWNFATEDYLKISAEEIKDRYELEYQTNGRRDYIALNHDPEEATASLGNWYVKWARSKGFKVVTLSECLGEKFTDAYKIVGKPQKKNSKWTCE